MKTGIWIDHREAVLVSPDNGLSPIHRIESGVEPRTRSSGGSKSGGTSIAQSITNEKRMDERHKHQLHTFYQKVIHAIARAESVYIFGPGDAGRELAKELEQSKGLHSVISSVEVCDKLTEPQITAKVKAFFKK